MAATRKLTYFSTAAEHSPEAAANCQRGERDILYDNPGFGTALHAAVIDDKDELIYDLPLNWNSGGGAVTIAVGTDGRIAFVDQMRYAVADPHVRGQAAPPSNFDELGRLSLELPRGFSKPGESWSNTARRETEEELNLPVLGEPTWLGSLNPDTAVTPHSIGVFSARLSFPADGRKLNYQEVGEEIAGRIFVGLDQLPELIASGRIFCGITLAALMLFQSASGVLTK